MDHFAETALDAKRVRVLDAAFRLVLAYGYQRTTMDDIARAAGMSRPGIYLLFKNKNDICRAIAVNTMRRSLDAAREALAGEAAFSERLAAAVDKSVFAITRPFAESPHGAELLDMKTSLCGDLIETWSHDLTALFTQAIAAEAERNKLDLIALGLSAESMASLILDGISGAKRRLADPDAQQEAARGTVRVVARALRA